MPEVFVNSFDARVSVELDLKASHSKQFTKLSMEKRDKMKHFVAKITIKNRRQWKS